MAACASLQENGGGDRGPRIFALGSNFDRDRAVSKPRVEGFIDLAHATRTQFFRAT